MWPVHAIHQRHFAAAAAAVAASPNAQGCKHPGRHLRTTVPDEGCGVSRLHLPLSLRLGARQVLHHCPSSSRQTSFAKPKRTRSMASTSGSWCPRVPVLSCHRTHSLRCTHAHPPHATGCFGCQSPHHALTPTLHSAIATPPSPPFHHHNHFLVALCYHPSSPLCANLSTPHPALTK